MAPHHVDLELAPGLDALSRVVARLHAVRAEVAGMRYDGNRVCLTLGPGCDAGRVVAVLQRIVDVRLVSVSAVCREQARPAPLPRTSYAVARTPMAVAR